MLIALLQNQVEWISFHSTYSHWWKAYQKISESSKDFCWITFLFIWIARLNFLSLKFIITLSLFFSRWHTCNSSGVISWQVKEIALQTVFSRTLSPMLRGTGLTTSGNSFRWYWALLKAFYSNWIICWCRRALQFFFINRSDFNSSCFEPKVSNLSFNAFNWMLISDNWSSSSICSSLDWTYSQFGFLGAPR